MSAEAGMSKAILITGTDTGVGKTVVTAGLASALRRRGIDAGVMKPVATGVVRDENGDFISHDTEFLCEVSGVKDPYFMVTPVCLEAALTPAVAAHMSGVTDVVEGMRQGLIDLMNSHPVVLVEGVGGFLVPLDDETLLGDFAEKAGMTVVVVARPGLGTINHTLLTVEAVQMRGLRVAGVVFNQTSAYAPDESAATNPGEIERFAGVYMLGTLPFVPDLSVEQCAAGGLVELVEQHLDVEGLIRRECSGE
jgi:dethiobiotin synthetase